MKTTTMKIPKGTLVEVGGNRVRLAQDADVEVSGNLRRRLRWMLPYLREVRSLKVSDPAV